LPLPWFRRKKEERDRPGAETAPAVEVEAPSSAGPPAEPGGGEAARKRRRRGSRGGRNRRKTAAGSVAESAPGDSQRQAPKAKPKPAAEEATRAKEAKAAERRSRSTTRRRQQARRAPLPAAKRELLVSVDVSEQRVAVLEDGRVAEVYLERPERRSIAGNIYKGVVDNVLPGMEAASRAAVPGGAASPI
jgi:hypothetical protein